MSSEVALDCNADSLSGELPLAFQLSDVASGSIFDAEELRSEKSLHKEFFYVEMWSSSFAHGAAMATVTTLNLRPKISNRGFLKIEKKLDLDLCSHMQDSDMSCTSKDLSELQNMVKSPGKHGEIT